MNCGEYEYNYAAIVMCFNAADSRLHTNINKHHQPNHMTKFIYTVVLSICITCLCQAQEIQLFEGEANLGITAPLGSYHNGELRAGPEFGLEFRYNFPYKPWDVGIALNVSTSVYKYDDPNSDWYWEQSNRSINLMAVGDYNFKQGSKFNPYVGVGVGISSYEPIHEVLYENSGTSFAFRPRVGIELFRHLRVAIFATIIRTGYNNFGVSIGGVIGGRPKKY